MEVQLKPQCVPFKYGRADNLLPKPNVSSNIYGDACRILYVILISSVLANQISRPGCRFQSGSGVRLVEDVCFGVKYAYMINVWWVAAMEILDRSHVSFINS